jgi:hypothetical protein
MIRSYLTGILVLALIIQASAQDAQYAFRVFFKDKNETTHTVSNPLQYLSQRAISMAYLLTVQIYQWQRLM